MPKFTPLDPKEFSCLPDGDYPFEVKIAEDGVGKESGNPYLKLTLQVFHGERGQTVTDYLSFGDKSLRKLWGFCQSTGTEKSYHDGEVTKDSVSGLNGILHLTSEEQDGFDPKNKVAYYKRPKKDDKGPLPKLKTEPLKPADEDDSSNIPF